MSRPEFITFTGLDAATDMDRVRELSLRYPIEWGVLFSPKRQGIQPRYPSLSLVEIIQEHYRDLRLSAHLCGLYAARVQGGLPPKLDLAGFRRAQVNCVDPDVQRIASFATKHKLIAITQHRTLRFPENNDIAWLYDCSGGTGDRPRSWAAHPGGDRLVGYAGGMGPQNIAEILEQINCSGPYWIDMETHIRTDDWLDLDKCEEVCRRVYEQ